MPELKKYFQDIKSFFRESIEREKLNVKLEGDYGVVLRNNIYTIEISSQRYYDGIILLVKGFRGSEYESVNIYPTYEIDRALDSTDKLKSVKEPMRNNLIHASECVAILFEEYRGSSPLNNQKSEYSNVSVWRRIFNFIK